MQTTIDFCDYIDQIAEDIWDRIFQCLNSESYLDELSLLKKV